MRLLAIDTSTEWLSLALQADGQVQSHTAAGGALTSTDLIPQIQRLMAKAGLRWTDLNALVFGAGPGSFTGLRSACAVVQGLAFGAGVPVLPVDTLLAVAEEARQQLGAADSFLVTALLDARMDQMYAACYVYEHATWSKTKGHELISPEALAQFTDSADGLLAGNVFSVYGPRLSACHGRRVTAMPSAQAMLRLAPALLASGCAVPAAQALPTYVRDKVAQTTAERAALKAAATIVGPCVPD
jgi:tRNA threonylcarbamoyladenosine biosynthesis protein TsaB